MKFKIGDLVTIKLTKERTKVKSIDMDSGGIYIYLENGDRVGNEDDLEFTKVKCPAVYKHFKNKYYATMGILNILDDNIFNKVLKDEKVIRFQVKHTETSKYLLVLRYKGKFYISDLDVQEPMVLYKSLYDDNTWIRPIDIFLSEVDHNKYPKVEQKYRFELI